MISGVDLTNEGEDMMILGDVNLNPPRQQKSSSLIPMLLAAILAAGAAGAAAHYLTKQPTEHTPVVDMDTQSIMELDRD